MALTPTPTLTLTPTRLTTLGPWSLGGKAGLLFFRQGRLHSPWGAGTWGIGADGVPTMSLGKCGAWRLTLDDDGGGFLVRHAGLEPQASRQGPRHACDSHA